MPWRLVLFLIVLAIVVAFAGFNIQNVATISFGFYTLEEVPVFLGLFAAFFLGVLVMLPFTLGRRRKSKAKDQAKGADGSQKGSKKAPEQPKLTEERESSGNAAPPSAEISGSSGPARPKRRKKKGRATKEAPGDHPPSSPS